MGEIEENWQRAKFYCSEIKLIYSKILDRTSPPQITLSDVVTLDNKGQRKKSLDSKFT